MTPLTWGALIVFFAGVLLATYAALSPSRAASVRARSSERDPLGSRPFRDLANDRELEDHEAFDALTEDARCDAVFAAGSHEDAASTRLLERALADPVEAVGLASAHALLTSGRGAVVDRFVRSQPSARAERIAALASLLAPPEEPLVTAWR